MSENCVFVEQQSTKDGTTLSIECDTAILTLSHPCCDLLTLIFNLSNAEGVAKLTSSYLIGTLLANNIDSTHLIGELLPVDVLEQLVYRSLTLDSIRAYATLCCLLVKDLRASVCSSCGIVNDITPINSNNDPLSIANIIQLFRQKLLDLRRIIDKEDIGHIMDDLNALWSDVASHFHIPTASVCRVARLINEIPLRSRATKDVIISSDANLLMVIRETLNQNCHEDTTTSCTTLHSFTFGLTPLMLWSVLLLADACEMSQVYKTIMYVLRECYHKGSLGVYLEVFPQWHISDIETKLIDYCNQYPIASLPASITIDPKPAATGAVNGSTAPPNVKIKPLENSPLKSTVVSTTPATPIVSPASQPSSNESPSSREEQVHDIISRYIQQQQHQSSPLPPLALNSPSISASTDSEEINLSTSSLSLSQAEQNELSNITSAGSLWIPPAPQPYPQTEDHSTESHPRLLQESTEEEQPMGINYLELRRNTTETPMQHRSPSPNHLAMYQARLTLQEGVRSHYHDMSSDIPRTPVTDSTAHKTPSSTTSSDTKLIDKRAYHDATPPKTASSSPIVPEVADAHNALLAEVGRARAMSRLQRAKHEAAMAELRKRISEEEKKARLDSVRIHAEMARTWSASKAQKPQQIDRQNSSTTPPSHRKNGLKNASPTNEELEQARRRAALRIKQTKAQLRQKELQDQAEAEAKEKKKWEERDKKIRAFIERQNTDTYLYYTDTSSGATLSPASRPASNLSTPSKKSVMILDTINPASIADEQSNQKSDIYGPNSTVPKTVVEQEKPVFRTPVVDTKNRSTENSISSLGQMTPPTPAQYSPVFMPHDILCVHVIRATGLIDVLGGTNAYCVLDWGKLGKSSTHAVRSCEPHFGSKLRFKSSAQAGSTLDAAMLSAPPLHIAVYSRNDSMSHECLGVAHVHDILLSNGKMLVPLYLEGKPSGAVELSISFL